MPISSASVQLMSLGMGAPGTRFRGFSFRSNLQTCFSMFFRNVVPVPGWNFNNHLAGLCDYLLATEPRVYLEGGGPAEPVGLVVLQLVKIVGACLHTDVVRGTGAMAAASVVETDAIVECHVEQGLLFAVVLVRQLAIFELLGIAFGQECDLHRV